MHYMRTAVVKYWIRLFIIFLKFRGSVSPEITKPSTMNEKNPCGSILTPVEPRLESMKTGDEAA